MKSVIRMSALWNLRKCIFIILLLGAIFISMSVVVLCQDDDPVREQQGGSRAPTPVGKSCQIYCLDREEMNFGPRWLAYDTGDDEIMLAGMPQIWQITKIEDPNIYTIVYNQGGGARRLRVNPEGGWVELGTPDQIGDYTKWFLRKISDDPPTYRIQTYKGVRNRWLYGCINDGSVGLSNNRNYMFSNYDIFNSDTSWQIKDRNGIALDL
jgi:hypothetical protein